MERLGRGFGAKARRTLEAGFGTLAEKTAKAMDQHGAIAGMAQAMQAANPRDPGEQAWSFVRLLGDYLPAGRAPAVLGPWPTACLQRCRVHTERNRDGDLRKGDQAEAARGGSGGAGPEAQSPAAKRAPMGGRTCAPSTPPRRPAAVRPAKRPSPCPSSMARRPGTFRGGRPTSWRTSREITAVRPPESPATRDQPGLARDRHRPAVGRARRPSRQGRRRLVDGRRGGGLPVSSPRSVRRKAAGSGLAV